MKRIAIFASGSGSNAENIIIYFQKNKNAEVILVLSNNPNAFVLERATKLGVKNLVFNKEQLNDSKWAVENLKNIDLIEQSAEWPSVEEELTDVMERLDELNEQFGNEKTEQIVKQFKKQVSDMLNEKNVQVSKELIEHIRTLNFRLIDEGAGVALEINLIKGFDDEFDIHDWSNINQAKALINQAKEIISVNPTKATLRPIVIKLYDLLPDINNNGLLSENDDSVLTN
jgi:hypothetical protein